MAILALLLIIPIFAFLPFFSNPQLLLNRNNDLTETFWPMFYYVKENLLLHHRIPYINTLYFAGTPLLADPQSPTWYLPNLIFLFTNIDIGIFISLFLHIILGTIGAYLVTRRILNFSKKTSLFLAFLFIFSAPLFSFFEAGHWGLIIAWNWIPLLIFSAYRLTYKANWKMIFLFAVSASSIYFGHILIAMISVPPTILFWIYKKSWKFPIIAVLTTIVIVAPAFIYQARWEPNTTRSLLLKQPEVFPVWRGKVEFIKTLFFYNPETEKAITLGIFPTIIALIGFIKTNKKTKLIVSFISIILVLIVLNNVSPVFPFLIKSSFFILMRVTIRLWFLVFLIFLYLVGLGLEKMDKKIANILIIISIIEIGTINYSYLTKPIFPRENIPTKIYEVFASDKTDYKILCLNRCIPQKEAAIRNLQLVEGYGTIQDKNYYYGIQKALNSSWDKYTLSIPPFDVYLYQDLQPNAHELLKYNTKYVISKHLLFDKSFQLNGKFGEYYLYINKLLI